MQKSVKQIAELEKCFGFSIKNYETSRIKVNSYDAWYQEKDEEVHTLSIIRKIDNLNPLRELTSLSDLRLTQNNIHDIGPLPLYQT